MSTEQGHPASTVRGVRWESEYRNLDDNSDAVPDRILFQRKTRLLARRRDISRASAVQRLKHGDAEIPDSEVR
jgi:hypothetical protein